MPSCGDLHHPTVVRLFRYRQTCSRSLGCGAVRPLAVRSRGKREPARTRYPARRHKCRRPGSIPPPAARGHLPAAEQYAFRSAVHLDGAAGPASTRASRCFLAEPIRRSPSQRVSASTWQRPHGQQHDGGDDQCSGTASRNWRRATSWPRSSSATSPAVAYRSAGRLARHRRQTRSRLPRDARVNLSRWPRIALHDLRRQFLTVLPLKGLTTGEQSRTGSPPGPRCRPDRPADGLHPAAVRAPYMPRSRRIPLVAPVVDSPAAPVRNRRHADTPACRSGYFPA